MATHPSRQSGGRAALRAERQREAEQARRRRLFLVCGIVLALVFALVAGFWALGRAKRTADSRSVSTGAVLASALQHIPSANYDAVGAGTVSSAPTAIPGSAPVRQDGKARVLYIGAEFCPYCAMDRLSLVAALSRFGTFSGLQDILSSPNENALSNIPTVSFRGASFSGDTVAFTGVETADRMQQPLDNPSAADQAIFTKYVPQGYIPFVYYGSAFANAAPYDGSFLAGQTAEKVANDLKDPTSQTSKAVLGGANEITAQICKETGGKPAAVCNSAGVTAAAKLLG